MTYICIKCETKWTIGKPTAEVSGGLCDSCITQYVRRKQISQGFHDCFRRATAICARPECSYFWHCLKGSNIMEPICSLCKKTLTKNDSVTCCYGNEGVYFFCSKECKDKWDCPVVPEKTTCELQRPSI